MQVYGGYGGQYGPPGNPLRFVDPGTQDSIGLSAETIAQLTTDQQTFFTDTTWETFDAFYAAVSGEYWFNASGVIGDNTKGVAVYPTSKTRYQLYAYATWWPVNLTLPATTVFDDQTEAEFGNLSEAELNALT